MKITKLQLRRIVKEELESVLSEALGAGNRRDRRKWRAVLTGEMELEDFKKQKPGWEYFSLRYPTIECLDGGPCPEGKKAWDKARPRLPDIGPGDAPGFGDLH